MEDFNKQHFLVSQLSRTAVDEVPSSVTQDRMRVGCVMCGAIWDILVGHDTEFTCRRCRTVLVFQWLTGGLVMGTRERTYAEQVGEDVTEELKRMVYAHPRLAGRATVEKMLEVYREMWSSKLTTDKKESMSLSAFAKRLLDRNTRVLVKAGFLDKELELTDEGIDELTALEFEAHLDKLVARAEEKLNDDGEDDEDSD